MPKNGMNGSGDLADKPQRGRPVKNTMPEPIPDTPENIARTVLSTPPKKLSEWKYLKRG